VEPFPKNTPLNAQIKGKIEKEGYRIENEIEELYSLEADPEELTNLALSEDYKTLLDTI